MPTVSQIVLTPQGQAKLARAIRAVGDAIQIGLAREMQALRAAAAARAPSPDEEAQLLSRGVSTNQPGGNVTASGEIGTPDGGRFIKVGDMLPLREAMADERIRTVRQLDQFFAGIGDPETLNARTGFSWATRRRGIQGPTLPFNRAYVQAMERGGVWIVKPRPENRSFGNATTGFVQGNLEPEDGVYTREMVKTLPPRRMYAGTLFDRAAQIRRDILGAAKTAVQEIR